ncbi:hypothetical protein Q8A73_014109 [Channa argus]|nr:hypothetical protein Q8A73_014109 [Channa argus]
MKEPVGVRERVKQVGFPSADCEPAQEDTSLSGWRRLPRWMCMHRQEEHRRFAWMKAFTLKQKECAHADCCNSACFGERTPSIIVDIFTELSKTSSDHLQDSRLHSQGLHSSSCHDRQHPLSSLVTPYHRGGWVMVL